VTIASAVAEALDHRKLAWEQVRQSAYQIHQHFRYEYPGEIKDLRQRLVLIPPARHGDQRLVDHRLEVSSPHAAVERVEDPFGNLVVTMAVDHVPKAIDFTAWITVERDAEGGPISIDAETYRDPAYREPSALTQPDDALRRAAHELTGPGDTPLALAGRINAWIYGEMRYHYGSTGVHTTAAEAFALRRGVCQDYAHVMIALCRELGLPARYVSGHMLGEGGTHAWVEVLLPDPERPGSYIARPFDPTHGREAGLTYITVAVGRDYGDVAPTSGTYCAPYAGHLQARKEARVTSVEYFAEPARV
jgi:transglutaminase-like putative cysteine protease